VLNNAIFNSVDICVGEYFKPRAALFKKLLGDRVVDSLLHMPLYTIEKVYSYPLSQNDIGKIVSTRVFVECVDYSNYSSRRPIKIWAKSGEAVVKIDLFNYKSVYAKKVFPIGKEIYISGKLTKSVDGFLQFVNPSKSLVKGKAGFSNVYPLSNGISSEGVYSVIKNALIILNNNNINEWIPDNVLRENNWKSFYESLFLIHNPNKIVENKLNFPEYQRICFDELLAEQLAMRLATPKTKNGNVIKNEKNLIKKLKSFLPFNLTKAQIFVINEIFKDMESGTSMTRLIQGDVGSGKTIVAVISALYAIESGYQCALLAPTEILARQHLEKIGSYFCKLGIKTEILTSNETGKRRKDIIYNMGSGESKILIGTHAILQDEVKFNNLGLVIIDEQHRFGVNQRLRLIEKGNTPHILSMTATPIPRTMILSQYGDIDVSFIKEKPIGRKEIITKALRIARVNDIIDSIKRIISLGQKVYWICPLIEESEKVDYTCVINRLNYMKNSFGTDAEMLHGKMKSEEKRSIFEKFSSGDFHILISTTVIEVGVDIPDATVIIIENAEKFGLAQLHQLRGRVGRSSLQSYCVLLYDDKKLSKIASERINIMKKTNDGFIIAEKDLILRGGGEIFGTKQSGQKQYKTFDFEDSDSQKYIYPILKQAAKLATAIINDSDSIDKYETLLKIFNKHNSQNIKNSF
jgi:ATP-dependent DNA helicase RecG